jgi:hypothetical protein
MRFESWRGQNEKNEKKTHFIFEKMYFLYSFFLAGLLTLHFKDAELEKVFL